MNYSAKDSGHYAHGHHDLLNLVSKGSTGLKVKELGAAYGETLFFLQKAGYKAEYGEVSLRITMADRWASFSTTSRSACSKSPLRCSNFSGCGNNTLAS